MNDKLKLLLLFLLLLFLSIRSFAVAQEGQVLTGPTDFQVGQELQKILGEITAKPENNLTRERTSLGGSGFNLLFYLLKYQLQIIVIIAFLVGVYFLVRSLSPYVRNESFRHQSFEEHTVKESKRRSNPLIALYQLALEQFEKGDYRQALISLQKATIESLLNNVIIITSGREYTNNDLKRRLKDHPSLYKHFTTITNYAEIAGFSSADISKSDFILARDLFDENFLKG